MRIVDPGHHIIRVDFKGFQKFTFTFFPIPFSPHSNYCFGEGGAGTYSDGKLYTRSKKRGKIIKTLRILHSRWQDQSLPKFSFSKSDYVSEYNRRTLTSRLADIFDNVLQKRQDMSN